MEKVLGGGILFFETTASETIAASVDSLLESNITSTLLIYVQPLGERVQEALKALVYQCWLHEQFTPVMI